MLHLIDYLSLNERVGKTRAFIFYTISLISLISLLLCFGYLLFTNNEVQAKNAQLFYSNSKWIESGRAELL